MSVDKTRNTQGSNAALRLIRVLSPLGLVTAAYLAVTYAQDQAPYCAGSGGCESVQTSEYVTIVGGLTVPILGVIGYVFLIGLTTMRGRLSERFEFYLPLLTYGAALIGFSYSAYLTYLEAYVIHAWCYWCLVSALLMTVIFVLSAVDLRQSWFAPYSEQ